VNGLEHFIVFGRGAADGVNGRMADAESSARSSPSNRSVEVCAPRILALPMTDDIEARVQTTIMVEVINRRSAGTRLPLTATSHLPPFATKQH
jgi:hypothetical protein